MHRVDLRGLAALVAGFAFVSCVAAPGSAEKGKAAFAKHGCWQCHGFEGQGGNAGVKIAPDPMPFEAFSIFVRNTSGAMPPYTKTVLPDADLADIHAYLQSVPKPRDSRTIPLLNP